MKKGNKKAFIAIGVSMIALTFVVVLAVIKYSSSASNHVVLTGESVQTIDSYENTGVTTYIGYGYNVVTKDYINADDVSKTNKIFNIIDKTTDDGTQKGIRNTNVIVDNASNEVVSYYINERSSQKFVNEFNISVASKTNITLNNDWIPFSAGVYAEASTALNHKNTTTSKSEYVKDIRELKTGTVTWEIDDKDFYQYLTDNFKRDILNMKPEELFDKYGTHFLRSVVLGGRVELNAKIEASTSDKLTSAVSSFKTTMNVLCKENENSATEILNANGNKNKETPKPTDSVSVENNISITDQDVLKEANIEFTTKCYGGQAKDFTGYISSAASKVFGDIENVSGDLSIDSSAYSNTYSQWLTTVKESPALVDIYDSDSLYPIWNLLDYFADNDDTLNNDDMEKRKVELREAFEKYGLDNYNNLIKKYEVKDNETVYATIDTELTGVKDETFYNKNKKLEEKFASVHNGYNLGSVIVTNTSKNEDGTLTANADNVQVMYKLEQDKDNLPVGDNKDIIKHSVIYDSSFLGSINGYGRVINKLMAGKGAYYVQVVYKDQFTATKCGSNFLKKMNKGDSLALFETDAKEVDTHGGIDKISVLVVYETSGIEKISCRVFNWLQEGSIKFK